MQCMTKQDVKDSIKYWKYVIKSHKQQIKEAEKKINKLREKLD